MLFALQHRGTLPRAKKTSVRDMRCSSGKGKEPNERRRERHVYVYVYVQNKRGWSASRSHIVQEDYLGLCPTERKQDHVASVCKTPNCRFSELELDSISRRIAINIAVFRKIVAFIFCNTYAIQIREDQIDCAKLKENRK